MNVRIIKNIILKYISFTLKLKKKICWFESKYQNIISIMYILIIICIVLYMNLNKFLIVFFVRLKKIINFHFSKHLEIDIKLKFPNFLVLHNLARENKFYTYLNVILN